MRTPAGEDCQFYYEDFNRGRNIQTCRAEKAENSAPWQPADCARCAVPQILRANAQPDLELDIQIKRGFLGFGRKVVVNASCRRHRIAVENPYTGCPQCNAERGDGLSLFEQALEDIDD